MPTGMNYTLTTLGLAICQPAILQARGPVGCPPNSRLGAGSALVEVPFGTGSGHEVPEVQAVVGPPKEGNMVVLFYANGQTPVFAQLEFTGRSAARLRPVRLEALNDGAADPERPQRPGRLRRRGQRDNRAAGLTYYKHSHGHLVSFHPLGIGVPEHCPRGGFPFHASFAFQDGSQTSASTTVPCPAPVRRRRHK